MRYLALLLMIPLPLSAETLCVTNASAKQHFFAISADDGVRVSQWLLPGAQLCLDAQGPGIASVYEEEDAFEGCSRRLPRNSSEDMHAYARFDRCTWSGHLN